MSELQTLTAYNSLAARINSIEQRTGREASAKLYRELFQLEDTLKTFGSFR